MPVATRTNVTCPQCRNQYPAVVEMVIDAAQDADSKMRLLSGRLNIAQCPYCGTQVTVASPLVYHDASKDLLITFIPMELGMSKDQQERVVGDLLRELTKIVPQGSMRGYFFSPRQALTLQGLIEQVLQADGVTPEMMEAQKKRARMIEQFLQADDETLPGLVAQHDADIDGAFLQTMGMFAQRALQDGAGEAAQQILITQQAVMQLSSYGKQIIAETQQQERIVQEVREEIVALGANAGRADILSLILRYQDDDTRLQALVGLARPALDPQFFQELTAHIGQAPAESRDALEQLRARLNELTQMVDAEARAAIEEAVQFLQALVQSPDPDTLLQENALMLDDTFMAVLSANLQDAEQKGNLQATTRLREIYEKALTILQGQMSPELRFINRLLTTPSRDAAEALIRSEGAQYGPGLIAALDAVQRSLEERGETQMAQHIAHLRGVAAGVAGG